MAMAYHPNDMYFNDCGSGGCNKNVNRPISPRTFPDDSSYRNNDCTSIVTIAIIISIIGMIGILAFVGCTQFK